MYKSKFSTQKSNKNAITISIYKMFIYAGKSNDRYNISIDTYYVSLKTMVERREGYTRT